MFFFKICFNDKSHTGWTTTGHTGEDVNTYAYGPGSEKFKGNIDNIDNAKNIFDSTFLFSCSIEIKI